MRPYGHFQNSRRALTKPRPGDCLTKANDDGGIELIDDRHQRLLAPKRSRYTINASGVSYSVPGRLKNFRRRVRTWLPCKSPRPAAPRSRPRVVHQRHQPADHLQRAAMERGRFGSGTFLVVAARHRIQELVVHPHPVCLLVVLPRSEQRHRVVPAAARPSCTAGASGPSSVLEPPPGRGSFARLARRPRPSAPSVVSARRTSLGRASTYGPGSS